MTKEKVIKILADYKGCEVEEINADASFADLGFDSLDVVDLVMTIEDECGVTIEMSENIKTVADVVKIIDSNK